MMMNGIAWQRHWLNNWWLKWWIMRSILIDCDILNAAATVDAHIFGQVYRQSIIESAKRMAIHRNSKLIRVSRYGYFEWLIWLHRIATVAFFMTPRLVLKCIANNCMLMRTNTHMQNSVIARLQRCTALNVDVTPTKNCFLLESVCLSVSG